MRTFGYFLSSLSCLLFGLQTFADNPPTTFAYIDLQRFATSDIFATPNGLIWLRSIVHDFATSQYGGLTVHILDG